MPVSTTNSQVLSIIQLMSHISNTLMNGLHMVDLQMMSGMTSVPSMRVFMGMLFVPQLSLSWYDLPSPSLATSRHLQPHPPPLHSICLPSAPTPKHTCATYATTLHPL